MRTKSRAGVTLLELLIAVSLLSLLSVGILMAMRVGLNAMEKANTKLMANRRAVGARRILESQIAGFMPVDALFRPGYDEPPVRIPFFHGETASMRFVSSHSLEEASRGYPRILEFQVIPGENQQGVRLVVNEHLYAGPPSAGAFCLGMIFDPILDRPVARFRPIEVGPRSFVLADRLEFCRFLYLEVPPPPEPRRWVPLWTEPQYPQGIRVEMAPLEPDITNIQPMSFTAKIQVNRRPLRNYADN